MKFISIPRAILLAALSLITYSANAVSVYVDAGATGLNNGTSWINAYTNLQNALIPSISGDSIFVATGTYKPDGAAPGNRSLSFNMKTGVILVGGFPAGGSTMSNRNWVSNTTILSGDIGIIGTDTDNSYHVVRCAGQQGELNGFIIERGRADGAAPDNDGGGLFNTSGYLLSRFCVYRNNFANDQGGGSYHDAGGNPQFRECKFESNSAAFGGGSYAFASTFIMSCSYVSNSATTNGGGVYAVVNINMYNLTLKNNSAVTSGNAIYYQSGGSNRLFNSIVWGNTGSATHIAGAGSINLRSCIIQGGCPGGGATCTAILNTDPLFSDAAGHLTLSSPAIDGGSNTTGDANSDNLTIDLENNNRNFDAIPGGVTRDMGSYENQSLNLTKYYVDHTATGANDGTNWANAFTSFQSAVAVAGSGDTVFVAAGTHKPSVGPSRLKKYTLVNGVCYYGGFPNGGGSFASRDFTVNRTILSGDIGTPIDSTDNCFVVVDATNLTNSTLMSGFTVEEGNSDSTGFGHPYNRAGGIHLGTTGNMRLDSVTVRNNFGKAGSGIYAEGPVNWVLRGCIFDNNTNASAVYIGGNASGSFTNCTFNNNQGFNGGAISLNVLSATFSFTNCNFTDNRSTASGGGGAINSGQTAGTYTNCNFINNVALTGPGGALYKFYATVNTFTNCTFTGNRAAGGGGALYGQGGFNLYQCVFSQNMVTASSQHGGAIYNNGTPSLATNCVFWSNTTTIGIGGAIYNNTGGTFNLTNCTFSKNNAVGFTQGGGINNNSTSNATISNCIFWGNLANGSDAAANTEIGHGSGTLTVTNTIWQGNITGGTIYNTDPLFTNTLTGDLTLTICSPAIDTATSAGAPATDVIGNARPFIAKPGGLDYDLGAYEFMALVLVPEVNATGNSVSIADGDITPSLTDHTDFGSQSVCSGTIVRTFTIENSGNANLTLSTPTITGVNAADFSITAVPTSPILFPGTTTFQVTFDPSGNGIRTAVINIVNSDCDEAPYDFTVQGFGTDPEVNVTGNGNTIVDGDVTPSLTDHTDFGSTGVCSGTIVRTFTILNVAPGNVNLTLAAPIITGTHAADFTVTTLPSSTISVSGSTTFQVTFNPAATGVRSATIDFTSNDCDESTYNFAIQGTGIDPEVNITGNSTTIVDGDVTPTLSDFTDFMAQSVCNGTVVRTYTIQNTGSQTLNISSVVISGPQASDFTITASPASSVAPAGSTTFQVTFNPSAPFSRNATITVNNSDCDEAIYDFAITGFGTNVTWMLMSQTNVSCNGGATGAATVSASGGISPYNYNWTPGNPTGDGTPSVSGLTAGTWTCTVSDFNGCTYQSAIVITSAPAITTVPSQTDISCNGGSNGSATVAVSGGNPGYTYSWAPSGGTGATASGLSSGVYTVTITDATLCTATQTFNITQPPSALAAGSSATSILCNGGTAVITVTGSGGTSPYTGTGTFTVNAGTHNYTVTDANGCTDFTTIVVSEPTALAASSSATSITCFGGNATVTVAATGGTAPYTGDGTFTEVAGTYTYTVTDANGCTTTTSVTITEPAVMAASSSATSIACFGGNATVTVAATGGTAPYTGEGTFTEVAGTYTYTVTDANGCTSTTSVTITEPTVLAATSSTTSIVCFGGNATVTISASGGTAPYTGDGTFTEVAGTYTYTVTDANGCTTTTSVTITEPTALAVTSSATSIACFGGNATVTVAATGGTAPYTGAGTFIVTAGTYTYTVTDANGCTTSTSLTVTEPAPFSPSSVETDITCFGGSDGAIDITVTGGTSPYTYDWNSGMYTTEDLTGLTAGTYSIVLTDANGCTLSGTMAVVQPSAIAHNGVVTDATGCTTNDGVIDLTTLGGTGAFTFVWSNSATSEDISGLDGGVYSVVITDGNSCTTSATFTITEPGAPTVTYSEPMDTACQSTQAPFMLSGESPVGGTWTGPGVTGNTFDPMTSNLGMNVIIYSFTDVSGCSGSASDSIWVDLCLDANTIVETTFSVYPNPTSGKLNINTNGDNATIVVLDALGQKVMSVISNATTTEIDLTKQANGLYFVRVEQNGNVTTQRVILNK